MSRESGHCDECLEVVTLVGIETDARFASIRQDVSFLYEQKCLLVHVDNIHTHDDTLRPLSLTHPRWPCSQNGICRPSRTRIEKLDICLVKSLFLAVNGFRGTCHDQLRSRSQAPQRESARDFNRGTDKQWNQTRGSLRDWPIWPHTLQRKQNRKITHSDESHTDQKPEVSSLHAHGWVDDGIPAITRSVVSPTARRHVMECRPEHH